MFGIFLFACMDTTTKYLAARYPAPMVVALRYIVQCLLMILLLAPTQGRKLIQTQRTGLALVRAACLATASLCLTLALQRMPVAEATATEFLSPMLVVLMAGPALRERVGMRSEEHPTDLQSLMRIASAVVRLITKTQPNNGNHDDTSTLHTDPPDRKG